MSTSASIGGPIPSTLQNAPIYVVSQPYISSSGSCYGVPIIGRKPRGPYKKDKFTVIIKSGPNPDKQEIVGKVKALDYIGKLLDNMPTDTPYDLEIFKHP